MSKDSVLPTPVSAVDIAGSSLQPQTGPWTSIDAWQGEAPVTVGLPRSLGETGTVMAWLRLDAPIVNGPDVETDGGTLLEFPDFGKVNVWWYRGYGGIVWETAEDMPDLPLEVPGFPGPQWLHFCYTWDAVSGSLDGYINGTPIRLPGTQIAPWKTTRPVCEVRIDTSRWSIAGLQVSDRRLDRGDVLAAVPSIYRGALDHTLGAQDLGTLNPDDWRGATLFENALSTPSDIAGWRMEGPGAVEFHEGWMRMRSLTPDTEGKEGHIVHWCDRDLPADFLLEFEVRIIGTRGLNIIFFCAKGRDGRDALDPTLSERTGVFGHYTGGDINCYHVSYYAHTPGVGGRTTSNLRKNHGFYLVDNGPIGIPPGDTGIHHVALLKRGGTIRLGIDGRCVMDWHDDGVHYGPVFGAGKMSLRQMKWTIAEYRNLRVSQPVAPTLCCTSQTQMP